MTIYKNKYEAFQNKKVCGIDIDGVLNNYPKSWIDFASAKIGRKFVDLYQLKESISYSHYKNLKHQYRKEGYECGAPLAKNASYTMKALKKLGYSIILLTARPHSVYKNMFLETSDWLRENKIVYDSIIWDENKHIRILQECPHLGFMVEDNAYFANLIGKWGYKCFLIENKYNKGQAKNGVIVVKSLKDIFKYKKVVL